MMVVHKTLKALAVLSLVSLPALVSAENSYSNAPVSYTHLTLPTKRIV